MHSISVMIIGSFIIQFFIMSFIMTNDYTNITFSLGKFYISVIMSLLMGILELIMMDYKMNQFSYFHYTYLGSLLVVFIYLYRNQTYIQEKDYLSEMIEHHSMALLTSEEILQKNISDNIKRLAENIIQTQEEEIKYMKNYISSY
jgi:hypothetical protein